MLINFTQDVAGSSNERERNEIGPLGPDKTQLMGSVR